MAQTYKHPRTMLNNPDVLFTDDIIRMGDAEIPALEHEDKVPQLKIFLRGETGLEGRTPDIVTERTEAYIVGWSPRSKD